MMPQKGVASVVASMRRAYGPILKANDEVVKAAPFAAYSDDPVGFFTKVLGIEPWGRHDGLPADQASQVDILEAVRDNTLVAERSGHKIAKSCSAGGLALWWVLTRLYGKVTLTAPTGHQVKGILWEEVRKIHGQQHPAQRGKTLPKLPGRAALDPYNGLELGPGWGIWGKTPDAPEAMSGVSGADQLFIIDEASGYPENLLEAILGNLAGGGKVLLIGNPTRTSGTFFDAFHGKRGAWKAMHTASTSTPNFFGHRIPGLADPEWLRTIAEPLWIGPGFPLYDVRVLGNFPGQASNSIVGLDLVEVARLRWAGAVAEGRLEVGLDVARDGEDESISFPRRGQKAIDPLSIKINYAPDAAPPGHQVGETCARHVRGLMTPGDAGARRPRIKVDSIGVGTAALDYLASKYNDAFEIIGVCSGSSADKTLVLAPGGADHEPHTAYDEYSNLRAQMAFGVAAWLRAGGALPPDEKLAADLVAPTNYITRTGKIGVEDKAEIKKRLKRSPDRGDALALSVYEPPQVDIGDYYSVKGMSEHRAGRALPRGAGRAMYR